MKKTLCLLLALIFVLSAATSAFAAGGASAFRTLEEIQASGVVTVACDPGYETAIAGRIAQDMGLAVNYVDIADGDCIVALNTGAADIVIGSFGPDGETEGLVDFAVPYLETDGSVLMAPAVAEGNESLRAWLTEEAVTLGEEGFFAAAYISAVSEADEAARQTDVPIDPNEVVTTREMNLRAGPGTDYDVAATVPAGTALVAIGVTENNWVRVWYNGRPLFVAGNYVSNATASVVPVATDLPASTQSETQQEREYVLNANTKKFHYPSCRDVGKIKTENRRDYTGTRDSVTGMGYSPCGHCNP